MKNKYPEGEKLHAVSEELQKLGFFLEWLQQRYTLCKFYIQDDLTDEEREWDVPEGYYPDRKSIQTILADYFEIDMKKVEEERKQILKELRDGN